MGQPVTVITKRTGKPNVVRFETNRALTGMAGEAYVAGAEIQDDRPPDVLAKRLFDHGGVKRVHVAANVITLEVEDPARVDEYVEILEDLYTYWQEGMVPEVQGS
jgi:hypothetical protein